MSNPATSDDDVPAFDPSGTGVSGMDVVEPAGLVAMRRDAEDRVFADLMRTPLAARDAVEAAPPLPLHRWPEPVAVTPSAAARRAFAPGPTKTEATPQGDQPSPAVSPVPADRAAHRQGAPDPAVANLRVALYVAMGGMLAAALVLFVTVGSTLAMWTGSPAETEIAEAAAQVPEVVAPAVEAITTVEALDVATEVVDAAIPDEEPEVAAKSSRRPAPQPAPASPWGVAATEPTLPAATSSGELAEDAEADEEDRRGLFRRKRRP